MDLSRTYQRRKLMLLTKLSVAVGLAGVALAANAVTYTPGTYTEKVNGHNAAFTVKVTVSKNKIEKIEYPDNLETIGVGKVALDKLSKKIIDRQSLGVDNVTGATITSFALKGAVKKALEQAKVSKADMAKLMKNSEKYTALPAEIKTNVVVVGGGGSGLASAIAAQQAGAKVIVLEKLGILGGSTNVSEGALNAIQKHYEQTMKGGHNIGNPDLVHYLTDHALESVHWLESIGVKFKDEVGTATGALWQRSHYPATPSGNTYIRSFEKYIAAHGNDMKVYTDMDAVSLIQDKAGRVIGVVARPPSSWLTRASSWQQAASVLMLLFVRKSTPACSKTMTSARASAARTSTSLPRAPASSWVKKSVHTLSVCPTFSFIPAELRVQV